MDTKPPSPTELETFSSALAPYSHNFNHDPKTGRYTYEFTYDIAQTYRPSADELTEWVNRWVKALTVLQAQAAEYVRQAVAQVERTVQNIKEYIWNDLDLRAYCYGAPHAKHCAWRKLKRSGLNLPNPARLKA